MTPQVFSTVSDLDVQSNMTRLSVMLQEGLTFPAPCVRRHGAAANFASVRINVTRLSPASSRSTAAARPRPMDASRFRSGGAVRLSVGPAVAAAAWTVRSISVLGQDALDGLRGCASITTDAVITLTDRIAELTGKVRPAQRNGRLR